MTITPTLVERFSLKNTGYKRNGLGVLCPKFRVRTWYLQRYIVTFEDGSVSSPLTAREVSAFKRKATNANRMHAAGC